MRHRLLAGLGLALACAHPAPADATSRLTVMPPTLFPGRASPRANGPLMPQ